MTNPTTVCPNCQHDQHLPGTECQTRIDHGRNFHLCLCLARPGAALSCPPQMTCQGGTLGYADVWYSQHGHLLVGEDGEIAPEAVKTGVASVGFPSQGDEPAVVPPVGVAALRDRIVEAECPQCGDTGVCNGGPCAFASTLPASIEDHRLALCDALRLGSDATWETILDRATELGLPPIDQDPVARRLGLVAAHRAAVLTEAADALGALDPVEAALAGQHAWRDAAALLRRLAGGAAGSSSPEFPDPKFKETAGNLNRAGGAAPNTSTEARCVCGHTKGQHVTVSGRLLCDECDPDSTDNLICRGFDAL